MAKEKQEKQKKQKKQFEFKIIAGALKGRTIVSPDLGATRPPLTRLRKAIFDYLAPYLPDAVFLDLFSGTGSYLFEAVSRGVKEACGVELESRLSNVIATQAKKLGVGDRLQIITGDVFSIMPRLASHHNSYDIIIMAPPQYLGLIDRTLALLGEQALLASGGQILCQHDSSETEKINWSGFQIQQRRKYGNTTFTILQDRQV